MEVYRALPIRLGQKAAETVSAAFLDLYSSIAGWFLGELIQPLTETLTTIPISTDLEAHQAMSGVLSQLSSARPQLVIVDLAHSMRSVLPSYSIISTVVETCEATTGEEASNVQYVFLFTSQLWDQDPAFAAIRALITSGRATVLADDGSLIGVRPRDSAYREHLYIRALSSARMSPLAMLKQKLIRQHGHLKRHRDGVHDHCVQYFFDGAHCSNELAQLIVDGVRHLYLGGVEKEIIVHDPYSPWLADAAEAAAIRLGISLRRLDLGAEGFGLANRVSDTPFVLVPMCDTGETCRSVIRTLTALNKKCSPSTLAVISTEGMDEQNGRRIIGVADRDYEVNYLLKVEQPRYPTGTCRQCRVNAPETFAPAAPENDSYEVPSFAMWSMILEAGVKPEDDVPDSRPSFGLVPDFPQIILRNGPYLACRMHAALSQMRGKLPRIPIILCPDETGARALADALTSLFKYTVVAVPRSVLRSMSFPPAASPAEDWYVQLRSLGDRRDSTEVIVLDEFNGSGGTRQSLKRLAAAFELGVRCYVSLFDFNPGLRRTLDAVVYSLYTVGWLNE